MSTAAARLRLLMSAFYPGYLITQIPAGALAQKYGAKLMLLLNLLGTAACFGCLPFAFRAGRVAFFLQGRVVIRGISGILRYLIPTYPPKFRLPTGVDS
jgi:fucose permease